MASFAADDSDEPLTPPGRLSFQPKFSQIVHVAIGFKNPIHIPTIKSHLQNSPLMTHPRFSSLMVRDSRGVEHWHKLAKIDLDRHIVLVDQPVTAAASSALDHEAAVNDYLADLSTNYALSTDKPMWEFHLLMAHNCGVFRFQHALGDGISLFSMLVACFPRADGGEKLPALGSDSGKRLVKSEKGWWVLLIQFLKVVWFTMVFLVEYLGRVTWVCDRKTAIRGGDGVELWPRKLATARFTLEDMKLAKKAVPNATINDVLYGVVSAGLSKYLDHQTPNALREGHQITGLAMVNLRSQPGLQELSELMKSDSKSSWGNKLGIHLIPIYYHKSKGTDPLQYLKSAKAMSDMRKLSLQAPFTKKSLDFAMAFLGSKLSAPLSYNVLCNTSFTISNIPGPQKEITLGGNPITYLRENASGLPHVSKLPTVMAISMALVSYNGKADLQILVAKDIIHHPEFLAKCFEDALLDMKVAAAAAAVS